MASRVKDQPGGQVAPRAEWLPIETAPRDGTKLDLWVVDQYVRRAPDNRGERITDAWWGEEYRPASWGRTHQNGEWTGWVHQEDIIHSAPIERELSGGDRFATHWMPLPDPPK